MANLLDISLSERIVFFDSFELGITFQPALYEKEHKQGEGLQAVPFLSCLQESLATGEIFPGRSIVRARVDFGFTKKDENVKSCSKKDTASKTHTPSIFTVECCCRQPKILGVSVMDLCEGVSTALSVLLSRFKVLPRCTYYGNASKLEKSVALRMAWLNELTRIACDRFHYRGHVYNSVNDPSAYP